MADLTLSLAISRALMGLPDLALNDHDNYVVGASDFLTTNQQWTRNQVGSSYTDGQVTTHRYKNMITMPLQIEVFGTSQADLVNNASALKAAFSQDHFILKHILGGISTYWSCEAADWQMERTGPRLVARQMLFVFSVPTQPNPITGSF